MQDLRYRHVIQSTCLPSSGTATPFKPHRPHLDQRRPTYERIPSLHPRALLKTSCRLCAWAIGGEKEVCEAPNDIYGRGRWGQGNRCRYAPGDRWRIGATSFAMGESYNTKTVFTTRGGKVRYPRVISVYPYDIEMLTSLAETPPLPSWLADYEPPPRAESGPKLKETESPGFATATGPASNEGLPGETVLFMEELKSCHNLVEIRKFLKSLDSNAEQKATCSRLAFSRLLDVSVPLQTLLEFLDDPSLNAPEAQNLQQLLGRLAKTAPNDQESEVLGNWLKGHVSLGRILEKDIEPVLNSAGHLGSGACPHNLSIHIATSLWDGLQSFSVLRPKSSEAETLNALLEHISRNDWSKMIQSLGSSIIRSVPISQLHKVQSGIATFMRSWLFAMRMSTGGEGQELPLPEDCAAMAKFLGTLPTKVASATLEMVITKELLTTAATSRDCQAILTRIVHLLEILPAEMANFSAASATSNICLSHEQSPKEGSGGLELLELWLQTLSKSDAFRQSISCSVEWQAFEKCLSARAMEKPYLRALSDRERCRFILRHWTLEHLAVQDVKEAATIISNTLSCFEGLNQIEHGTAPYGDMIRALRQHTKSLDNVIPRLFSLLSSLGESQMTVNVIRRMQRLRLPIDAGIIYSVIKEYCRTKPAAALTLFQTHRSLSLAECPELAESIIADPETGPDTAFLYIRRDGRRRARLKKKDSRYQGPDFLDEEHIQLLHRMAVAFANAAHLRPRIAFRFVYRCYIILKNVNGGVFDAPLSLALTVAGIIRPLQRGQWVSTMKLRWILRLVKNIEGEEVANELDERVFEWRGQVVRATRLQRWQARELELLNEIEARKVGTEPESVESRALPRHNDIA